VGVQAEFWGSSGETIPGLGWTEDLVTQGEAMAQVWVRWDAFAHRRLRPAAQHSAAGAWNCPSAPSTALTHRTRRAEAKLPVLGTAENLEHHVPGQGH
jgi:hypothetical protein